jgi:hypothetical protein
LKEELAPECLWVEKLAEKLEQQMILQLFLYSTLSLSFSLSSHTNEAACVES